MSDRARLEAEIAALTLALEGWWWAARETHARLDRLTAALQQRQDELRKLKRRKQR